MNTVAGTLFSFIFMTMSIVRHLNMYMMFRGAHPTHFIFTVPDGEPLCNVVLPLTRWRSVDPDYCIIMDGWMDVLFIDAQPWKGYTASNERL